MKQLELKNHAISCADKIINAEQNLHFFEEPFKHIVLDNFFEAIVAQNALSNFPPLNSEIWDKTNDPEIEVKMRSKFSSEFDFPDGIIDAVRILNSSYVLKAIADKLDIPKLMPDPYFSGGGLNVTVSGGLLDVHVDGNYHDASGLNRRVNVILYLNPRWGKNWGGEFGIYDNKGEVCLKEVEPLYNRLVIFDTHDYSFHGLPNPLSFPEGEARRSIILYYYTKEPRPTTQIAIDAPHSALWKKKNWTDKKGNHTRNFE
jgi:Rps23 Pro-64 3,4-dihydroxylase Tpa1-like proline 4-hydroxylase